MNKLTDSITTTQAVITAYVVTGLATMKDRRDDQRGVVSIEYLVLGAALIVLIGVLATNTAVSGALGDAFAALFKSAGE